MIDGPHLFLQGKHAYVRLNDLSINLSVAGRIAESEWEQYLDGTYALSLAAGSQPCLSLVWFVNSLPDATIRQRSAAFMREKNIAEFTRIVVLAENALTRGAMTAFGWLMKKSTLRAFAPAEYAAALRWLLEGGKFDVAEAEQAFVAACDKFGLSAKLGAGRKAPPR